MPSKDWEKRIRSRLDQPGLSPTQAKDIEQDEERKKRNEEARFIETAQKDIARADAMRQQQEARAKEYVLKDLSDLTAQAKAHRLSAKEIAQALEDIDEVVAYFEGDGKDRQGVLHTIETGYAKAEEILADPGAYADDFYRRYPTLAETRFHMR